MRHGKARQLIAYLLVVILIVSMLPTAAFAESTDDLNEAEVTLEPTAEAETPIPTADAEPTDVPAPTAEEELTPAPTEIPVEETPTPTEVPAEETPAPTEIPAEETPAPTEIPVEETPEPTPESNIIAEGSCGEEVAWTLDNDGVLSFSGTGEMTDYINYEKIPWYSYRSQVTSVVIENGVTNISDRAFIDCTSLTKVSISNSVTSIGQSAFSQCASLSSITIPNGVTRIDNFVFEYCTSLSHVQLPASVTSMGVYAFSDCPNLTSAGALGGGCDIEFGWTKSIPANAFNGCASLNNITIPESITSIGASAFDGCSKLATATILGSNVSFEETTFDNCSALTTIYVPAEAYDAYVEAYSSFIPAAAKFVKMGEEAPSPTEIPVEETPAPTETPYEETPAPTETPEPTSTPATETPEPTATPVIEIEIVAEGTCGENLTWKLTDDGALTISGSGEMTDYDSEGAPWYSYRNGIISAVIESGATSVGGYAFYECEQLTSVTIPNGVTRIGKRAFWLCAGLTNITIPDGVSSIGEYAFGMCTGLTDFIIPGSVISIGENAFTCCVRLTDIIIPSSVTSIGAGAFCSCEDLSSMVVDSENSVYHSSENCIIETASKTLIAGCKSSVIPTDGSVTSIGNNAFGGCSGLTSITIPSSITTIGMYAFQWCTGLTSITIPDGVTSIGGAAFQYCSKLTNVIIREGITDIGWCAFETCTSLTNISIPSSVDSIGVNAFSECDSLTTMEVSDGNAVYHSKGNCIIETDSKTLIAGCQSTLIPADGSVTSIGEGAFSKCTNLTSIIIPGSIVAIGESAFDLCSSLTDVYYRGSESDWNAIAIGQYNECLTNATIHYAETPAPTATPVEETPAPTETPEPTATPVVEIEVIAEGTCGENLTWKLTDDGTLTISGSGDMANYGADWAPWYSYQYRITAAVIEDGVTSIGNYAFSWCTSLTSIVISDSVTSIGYLAFQYCRSLISVAIPSSATSIGSGSFTGCDSLSNLKVDSGNSVYHSNGNCIIETASKTLFAGCKTSVIPADGSVTSIGGSAFYDYAGLISITIPSNVTSIGRYAFCDCDGLTSITIPVSVTNIGSGAFDLCDSLTDVYYGGSIDDWNEITIGEYNDSLKNATIHYDEPMLSIVLHPCDATVSAGTTAKFTVSAKGDGLTYQWQYRASESDSWKNSGEASATTDTLSIEDTADKNGYQYRCLITDSNNVTIYSNAATLHIAEIGENLTWKLSDDGTLTISGSGAMDDSYGQGIPWRSYKEKITAVIIESGVTNVGSGAFNECANLTSVTFPDSVTTIGDYAFRGTGLTSIAVPDSVTAVGSMAFAWCPNLTSVTLPEGLITISARAFSNNESLTDGIVVPSTVISIGQGAFGSCPKLTGLQVASGNTVYHSSGNCIIETASKTLIAACNSSEIPADGSVNSIYQAAFFGCDGLTSITIPDSVTSIGAWAFWNCYGLTSVSIPDSVNSIGEWAFTYCTSLTDVTLPSGLMSIARLTFYCCSSLADITIPSSVTNIGNSAFAECSSLTDVYYGGSESEWATVTIGEDNDNLINATIHYEKTPAPTETPEPTSTPVAETPAPTEVPEPTTTPGVEIEIVAEGTCGENLTWKLTDDGTLTISGSGAMADYDWDGSPWNAHRDMIGVAVIEDGVTSIGVCSFQGCSSLVSVIIPSGVTSIGDYAFEGCVNLTYVQIPTSVTSIESSAFSRCSGLTSVGPIGGGYNIELGWTKSIPDSAFAYCGSLTSVTIPSGVTNVGNSAFLGCEGLTAISIPNSVTSIGSYAFGYCGSLASITIPGSVTGISDYTCIGCTNLTRVVILEGVTSIGYEAFADCSNLAYVQIPSSVSNMNYGAFGNCSSLTSVGPVDGGYSIEIGWKETIPEGAFAGCTGLTKAIIPEGVITIGNYAFSGCTNLKSIVIPDSVTRIGYDAFKKCVNLTDIVIPAGVTSIGFEAFVGCTNLISMEVDDDNTIYHSDGNCIIETASKTLIAGCQSTIIPSDGSVTYIGSLAFADCASLISITIPIGVENVGWGAFQKCTSMTSITIPGSVKILDDDAFSGCDSLKTVYYGGSENDWNEVFIGWNNEALTNADIHYNDTITTQPSDVTVHSGETAKFIISTIGDNVTYQWQYRATESSSWKNSGATSATTDTFSIKGTLARDGYQYRCEVTDGKGNVLHSKVVTLHVVAAELTITQQPTDVKVPTGTTAEFSVIATGEGLTYQWQYRASESGSWKNSSAVSAATNTFSVKGTAARNGYQYRCEITDENDKVIYTTVVTLHVVNLTVSKQPSDATVSNGATAEFSVAATGDDITYQWQYRTNDSDDWKNVSVTSATTDTLSIQGTTDNNGYQYRCKITDSNGIVIYTNVATLHVANCAITRQPTDAKVPIGTNAEFSVIAVGDGLSYQWQYRAGESGSWKDSGAASAAQNTFSVKGTAARNGYQYRCEITDESDNVVYTTVVTLHVVDLTISKQPSDATVSNGATAEFSVAANGDELTYQWQYRTSESDSWKDSSAATANTDTLGIQGVMDYNRYQYRCKITDGNGVTIYTNAATLYVANCTITKQPSDVAVYSGATAKFIVTAIGDDLTYQWQYRAGESGSWKNSSAASATTDTFSLKGTAARDGYQYRCKITDENDNVIYTTVVTLHVVSLSISKQPSDVTVLTGNTAVFSVTAMGDSLTYQWQYRTSESGSWKNSGAISATTNSFSVKGTAARDGYQYRCMITDSSDVVIYTNTVTLYVTDCAITSQPSSATVSAGATAKFTVAVTGDNLSYQWQYRASASGSWKNSGAASATTNTFSIKGTAARNGYQYRCKITDSNGNVIYTDVVTLTVN